MAPVARTANPKQQAPLYDINPATGVSIEVFYADRTLETFGWGGAGWFWWSLRRGCSPDRFSYWPICDKLCSLSQCYECVAR